MTNNNLTSVALERINKPKIAKYGEYAGFEYRQCIFKCIDTSHYLYGKRVFMNIFKKDIGKENSPHNIIKRHLKLGAVFAGIQIVEYDLPNKKRKYHIHNFIGNVQILNFDRL